METITEDIIKRNSLKRVPYDNFSIYHPDGTMMCYCSIKKAKWYLKRGLGKIIDDENRKIQLNFTPKGYGDPIELLEGRKNCCVISGKTHNLTKHHVIPLQYRRHLPNAYKDKNSCDLMVLNREDHDTYEIIANDFKLQLYNDCIEQNELNLSNDWIEAKSINNCIKTHFDKVPHDRQVYMLMRRDALMEKWNFSDAELISRSLSEIKDYNEIIVEKIGGVNLIVLWKLHFLKYAKPQYLPKWWAPNTIKVIHGHILGHDKKTELVVIDMEEPKLKSLILKYDLL